MYIDGSRCCVHLDSLAPEPLPVAINAGSYTALKARLKIVISTSLGYWIHTEQQVLALGWSRDVDVNTLGEWTCVSLAKCTLLNLN